MSPIESSWTTRCPHCGLVVSGEVLGAYPPYLIDAQCDGCKEWFEADIPDDSPLEVIEREVGSPYDWSEEVTAHNRERSAQLQFELNGGFC